MNPFRSGGLPSYSFTGRFLRRHKLKSSLASGKHGARLLAEYSQDTILKYFQAAWGAMKEFGIPQQQIWNLDETRVRWDDVHALTVIVSRDQSQERTRSGPRTATGESVLFAPFVNAQGTRRFDVYIVGGGKKGENEIEAGGFELAGAGASICRESLQHYHTPHLVLRTATGTVTRTVWRKMVEGFLSFLGATPDQPDPKHHLLIVDGAPAHKCVASAVRLCRSCVHLQLLPPRLSHALQPLDVAMFATFKQSVHTAMGELLQLANVRSLRLRGSRAVGSLLAVAALSAEIMFTARVQHDAFRSAGILPVPGKPWNTIPAATRKRIALGEKNLISGMNPAEQALAAAESAMLCISCAPEQDEQVSSDIHNQLDSSYLPTRLVRDTVLSSLQTQLDRLPSPTPARHAQQPASRAFATALDKNGGLVSSDLLAMAGTTDADALVPEPPQEAVQSARVAERELVRAAPRFCQIICTSYVCHVLTDSR